MVRILWGICVGMTVVQLGCGHQVPAPEEPPVREIRIADGVTPDRMYAEAGEEIRWTNVRATPVRIGFLTTRLFDEVGCEKGVRTIFGKVDDLITIPPGGSISVCFERMGELKYNVWFEPENPRGPISPTATVRIESRG